jgi:hypothetical protein
MSDLINAVVKALDNAPSTSNQFSENWGAAMGAMAAAQHANSKEEKKEKKKDDESKEMKEEDESKEKKKDDESKEKKKDDEDEEELSEEEILSTISEMSIEELTQLTEEEQSIVLEVVKLYGKTGPGETEKRFPAKREGGLHTATTQAHRDTTAQIAKAARKARRAAGKSGVIPKNREASGANKSMSVTRFK